MITNEKINTDEKNIISNGFIAICSIGAKAIYS